MSAFSSRFLIAPDAAVEKFLVDMRVTAERSYGAWMQVLDSGFAKTALSAADRRALLKPHQLEIIDSFKGVPRDLLFINRKN